MKNRFEKTFSLAEINKNDDENYCIQSVESDQDKEAGCV